MFGSVPSIVVVFIDRNRLQFYGSGLSAILVLDIPPTVAADLEIVNRDGLYTLVNQWLKQNNLGGAELFFLLSSQTYFEKIIEATGESEQETEILAFNDSVPFEELATNVFTIEGKKRVVVSNRGFIEAISHAFILQGYHVMAAVPAAVLGTIAAKRWLDAEMGLYVLKHVEILRGQTIMDTEESSQLTRRPATVVPTSKNNPRLMIMVSILGVLLLGLIVVIFTRH